MDRQLSIRLNISIFSLVYCLVIALLACASIFLAALPVWWRCVFIVFVFYFVYRTLRSFLSPVYTQVEYKEQCWFLCDTTGALPVILARDVFLGMGIMVLPFVTAGGKKLPLVLWPDSAAVDDLRCLRLILLGAA